jgi:hypothetical protein
MIQIHRLDNQNTIELNSSNQYYDIYSDKKYIFLPNEIKQIQINIKTATYNDRFLYFLMNDKLQSIFNIINNSLDFYSINGYIILDIQNKTDKNIIINSYQKFITLHSDYLFNKSKINQIFLKIYKKNINNLIFDHNIELQNNNLIFFN